MRAVIAGSFDPVTVGHLDIIKRASSMFDSICVAVCINSDKPGYFSPKLRYEMLKAACDGIENVFVDTCDGLLTEYTERHGISIIVRGIRDASDLPYEMMLSNINRSLRNHPDTIFVPSKPEHSHISSSYVRDMIKYRENLDGILPDPAIQILKEKKLL